MAKQQPVKSTSGKDPFETLIPDRLAEQREVIESHGTRQNDTSAPKKAQRKEKLTVHLTPDLIERVKNAAYWSHSKVYCQTLQNYRG